MGDLTADDDFATKPLPVDADAIAPDGSAVRILLTRPPRGGLAHFELQEGDVSTAVRHRTVEEIWYVLEGRGEMWRRRAGREETVGLAPGTCLTIPLGTVFQFRSIGPRPLRVIGATMPPWPGPEEAVIEAGIWPPTVGGGGVDPDPPPASTLGPH